MDEQPDKPKPRARKKRVEQPAEPVPPVEEASAAPEERREGPTGAGSTGQADEEREEREPVNVFALAQFYLTLFADLAFQRMGLHADAATGVVVKDMEQAKAAVDITAFLADQLMPKMGENGRRELMGLVRDLRLNYARQMQPAEPGGA